MNHRIKDTCKGLIQPKKLDRILQVVQGIQKSNEQVFTGDVRYLGDYKGKHFPVFDGHRLRLISYFRQVYIIIRYLYEQDEKFLNTEEKDFYLRLCCSQMSEHEIALKVYHSSDEWVTAREENIEKIFAVFPFHGTLNWDNRNFFSVN